MLHSLNSIISSYRQCSTCLSTLRFHFGNCLFVLCTTKNNYGFDGLVRLRTTPPPPPSSDAIRVVQLNGQVDEFPAPVTVKVVLQHHPLHFICTSRHLHTVKRPLLPEEELRLGELYFLLPLTAADNLEDLGLRLYAAARKEASKAAQRRRSAGSTCVLPGEGRDSMYERLVQRCDDPAVKKAFRGCLISKSRRWCPSLPTIKETSCTC